MAWASVFIAVARVPWVDEHHADIDSHDVDDDDAYLAEPRKHGAVTDEVPVLVKCQ